MVALFWISTFALLLLAVSIVFPWLKIKQNVLIFITLAALAYPLYLHLGSSQHLKAYYSINHHQRARMQPLMVQLKKQEYRLRLYLEEYPGDNLARSQLLEILGVQALQVGDKNSARKCFEEALVQMKEIDLAERKQHLRTLLQQLD